jgi:hypothetical protein
LKIALVHNAHFPVVGYGGTERVIWWLARALSEFGHEVTLGCAPGSRCDFARVHPIDFSKPLPEQLPSVDIHHFFFTPSFVPETSYLVTIEGNGKLGERFHRNTAFVSRNHAERHGAECFVYNGVDPNEYRYEEKKSNHLIFLAKASWRVKNVSGAMRIARKARKPLHVMGGRPRFPLWNRWKNWERMISGERKIELIATSSGLLFPVIWNEPFGIAVVEALVSGTPVVASRRGSLPELVPADCGWICDSETEMVEALKDLGTKKPKICRDWALRSFHYHKMAKDYFELYERVLAKEFVNAQDPVAKEPGDQILKIPVLA